MAKFIDMTGWVMAEHGVSDSRLTVIERAENARDGRTKWLCECNCKDKTILTVDGSDIRKGHTKSCGCISREKTIERNVNGHKTNKYDLSGPYGVGWTSNTNQEFYFDLEDYDKIKGYCWRECVDKTNYRYLAARVKGEKNKIVKITHVIIGKYYDHKNRNTFDNRKANLRKATFHENARNKSIQKNNTSNVSGVSYDKNCNKWRSYICINNKRQYIGYCDNKEDAIVARLQAEAKYFGEFAPQRHLFEQYEINVKEGPTDDLLRPCGNNTCV